MNIDLAWSDWEDITKVAAPLIALALAVMRFLVVKRPQARIRVHEVETKLIDNLQEALPNFEASYNNAAINDLTVSQFYVWNAGTEALGKSSTAPRAPLRIALSDKARVLECSILRTTQPSLNFQAAVVSAREVELTFDYLNLKDGALVQILFTGATGADTNVEGQIIGPRPKVEYTGDEQYRIHGWAGAGGLILLSSAVRTASSVTNFLMGALLVCAFFFSWPLVTLLMGLGLLVLAAWTWLPGRNEIPRALREDAA